MPPPVLNHELGLQLTRAVVEDDRAVGRHRGRSRLDLRRMLVSLYRRSLALPLWNWKRKARRQASFAAHLHYRTKERRLRRPISAANYGTAIYMRRPNCRIHSIGVMSDENFALPAPARTAISSLFAFQSDANELLTSDQPRQCNVMAFWGRQDN
jgi:hypothetical protein